MDKKRILVLPRHRLIFLILLMVCGNFSLLTVAHEAKDFDDAISYKIDFEVPDFDKFPDLKNHLKTFYTHEKEKYECLIPPLDERKEEKNTNDPDLSIRELLEPIFSLPACTYRIEPYWSYEICHGIHLRQYHEERDGKSTKFQEYFLGKWDSEKTDKFVKEFDESRKSGIKLKTLKIDNTKYPYLELEMTDGTKCDIINAQRSAIVRYVCYPQDKNEIYSLKETSSCNYEVIILTSALCLMADFHPEESKEVSIKCFNSQTELHKPISMLREELKDLEFKNMADEDVPITKESSTLAFAPAAGDHFLLFNRLENDDDKLALEIMINGGDNEENLGPPNDPDPPKLTPIKQFISGKHCLTGGSGWWKYEFCFGRYVRQFHTDKKSDTEVILGYFNEDEHKKWITAHPDKSVDKKGRRTALWHHYARGTHCERTGLERDVDVKLTCTHISPTAVSMYLLEPKTCQYILVVESPIVCDLLTIADEFGLIKEDKLDLLLKEDLSPYEPEEELVLDRLFDKLGSQNPQPVEQQPPVEGAAPENART